jgi:membrane protein YdbS with pleckstrin-like domain
MQLAMSETRAKYPLSEVKIWKKTYGSVNMLFAMQLLGFAIGLALIFGLSGISKSNSALFSLGWIVLNVLVSLAVFAGYYWWQRWYFFTYFYDLGADHLTIRKGTLTPREITVPYPRIQDVYVDQDLFDRVFGLYDVHLSTATQTSGMEAHIDGLGKAAADGLRAELLGLIHSKQGTSRSVGNRSVAMTTKVSKKAASNVEVTEKRYPIQKKWIIYSLVSRLISGIFAVLIFIPIYYYLRSIDVAVSVESKIKFFGAFGFVVISSLVSTISLPLWVMNFHYALEDENITIRSGIIAKSVRNIRYGVIQDVLINQGLLDRILGLSSLTIENAAQGGLKITIPGLLDADAKTMKQLIQKRMQENSSNEAQTGGL